MSLPLKQTHRQGTNLWLPRGEGLGREELGISRSKLCVCAKSLSKAAFLRLNNVPP